MLEKKTFRSLTENIGQFDLRGKKLLIPEMNRIGCYLLAGTFRGFGINALVIDTSKDIDLGMEYSSGKECYPCQVTLGDILSFMQTERERLGDAFNPAGYIYFMPESRGPCRFGMYNKFQRIVLDTFPELKDLKIGSISTQDGYSLDGIIDKKLVGDLKKSAYFSVVVADILDRLLWRIRPYEREEGMTDEFIERAMRSMAEMFESHGARKDFNTILDQLVEIIEEGRTLIDPAVPPKPLIGLVGEIYLRCHTHSNQELIRVLERHGAEVVNASIAEWVNYVSYEGLRESRKKLGLNLKQFRVGRAAKYLRKVLRYGGELYYQQIRQRQVYKRVRSHIDLAGDHNVAHLEDIIKEDDLFNFDIGTEACLSIAGIIEYARHGYNGVLNVYPFTCMPSTITSAIAGPLMSTKGVPYLDTPYDSGFQPGREAAIRTFMFQALQHCKRHGRRRHHEPVAGG